MVAISINFQSIIYGDNLKFSIYLWSICVFFSPVYDLDLWFPIFPKCAWLFSEGELRQVMCHMVNAVHHSKQFVHLIMRECYDLDDMLKTKQISWDNDCLSSRNHGRESKEDWIGCLVVLVLNVTWIGALMEVQYLNHTIVGCGCVVPGSIKMVDHPWLGRDCGLSR